MRKRLFNQTAITGYGSLILAIAPFFVGDTKMSVTTWALVFIGVVLVLYGVIYPNKTRGYTEMKGIIEQRQEYLPQLRNIIEQKNTRMGELSKIAGNLSLETYYQKYLALNNTYPKTFQGLVKTHKDELVRRKVAIIVSLKKLNFGANNAYLSELIYNDHDGIQVMDKKLVTCLARNSDKALSQAIIRLTKTQKSYYSIMALQDICLNNGFDYKAPKYITTLYDAPNILKPILLIYLKNVDNRIDELLKGEDL
jgi:hypothetical protein